MVTVRLGLMDLYGWVISSPNELYGWVMQENRPVLCDIQSKRHIYRDSYPHKWNIDELCKVVKYTKISCGIIQTGGGGGGGGGGWLFNWPYVNFPNDSVMFEDIVPGAHFTSFLSWFYFDENFVIFKIHSDQDKV